MNKKKDCICFKNYSIDISDKQIFLTETDYPTLINMHPNIKNMYLEYYTNNNINNSNVIQKAFNRARRILVEMEVLSIEFDIAIWKNNLNSIIIYTIFKSIYIIKIKVYFILYILFIICYILKPFYTLQYNI